ncbi:MAG TPA: extracellular solute-binding protein [Xanthobacteraceae bacterium]|nr:extracellular solute-binding protein [Xanthobacteraceae bacterium]
MTPITRRLTLAAAFALAATAAYAQGIGDKLVIVTSFSKDLTVPFATAFEKKHPGVKVEVQNRNSAAAIAFIRETRSSPPDIFWASAPDAFEVLKKNSLLQKYKPQAQGVADKVGSYPINDPDGFYAGFAASGYGIMYNTRYTRANNLPAPKEWDDLKQPIYFGHVGFSAPSRSGTSHLTVETILQGEGWDNGWALLLEIAGNFQQVSDRSFGVPDAVNSGQYGVGIVIDFFGLSAKASGFPVEFVYPSVTAIVPANVGIIANAKNQKTAEAFVEFLLSEDGQQILLDPKIQRLPVRPASYAKAPAGYPNPFSDKSLGAKVKFDADVSEGRYELVNSLFDRVVTFRLKELNAAWKAIHAAEKKHEAVIAQQKKIAMELASAPKEPRQVLTVMHKDTAEALRLIAEARKLATSMPITEKEAGDKAIAGSFQEVKPGAKVAGRQAEFEQKWDAFATKNYAEAKALAEKALALK